MPNREWGRDEEQQHFGRDIGRDFQRDLGRDRDEQWMRDERWRRDLGRDFSRLEWSPNDRELRDLRDREMRELRDREMRDLRDRELRGYGAYGYGSYGTPMYQQRPMGRAPKGYQRSDERIKEDLCDWLLRSWVDAEEVEIQVRGGDVILAGTVEDRQSKRMIEDLAEQVLGVKDVQNNIRVQPRGRDDEQQQQRAGKKPSA